MKLLFIMETIRARGAERVAAILANQLAAMSHDVYLVCTGFVRGDEYPLNDSIHIDFIPEATGTRPYLAYVRVRYIRKKLKEIEPDCILSLATARTLSFITAACIGSSIPLVFSERNDPVHDPKTKIERFLRLICFHACDRVVFQTEDAKNFFPSSIRKKGTIIPNPIKEELPPIWNQKRKPYIVNFCKLVPQKNLFLLLRAFYKISSEFPETRLVLYGDGELKQSLEQEADKLCISSRVDIHPATLKVHELIKDCTMYVSSSDYEGQSNSMLEAMAIGLPCICTDCPSGGARAIINPGINGLLVPVGNTDKLADAMRYMLLYPEEARRMGINASKIRDKRSPELIAQEWNHLILELTS